MLERPKGQALPKLGCAQVADQQRRVEFELAEEVVVSGVQANAVKDLIARGGGEVLANSNPWPVEVSATLAIAGPDRATDLVKFAPCVSRGVPCAA